MLTIPKNLNKERGSLDPSPGSAFRGNCFFEQLMGSSMHWRMRDRVNSGRTVDWRSLVVFGALAILVGFVSGCRQETNPPAKGMKTVARAREGELASPSSTRSESKRPLNVLLLTLDTVRADALGVYGQKRPTTPNIDRLAQEGVMFRNAVSVAPNTLPSHTSIMTGTYPFVHGARSNGGYVVSEDNVMLAEILSAHGYLTAAEISGSVLNRRTGIDQGFASFRDLDSPDIQQAAEIVVRDGKKVELKLNERYASDVTQKGIDFLKSARGAPFFLWLHYFAPHAPYLPPEPIRKQIPGNPYLGEVRYVDHEIGALLEALGKLGLTENTLIVLTADHGESLGEHKESTHSLLVYDSTIHVPLIFHGPDQLPKNFEVAGVARIIDVAPTILDLLGYAPMEGVQGVSLVPLLMGLSTDLGLLAYGESLEAKNMFGSSTLRFLRRGNWKYIHKVEPELYDLRADPAETRNLIASQPEIASELRADLRELISQAPTPINSKRIDLTQEEESQLEALGYFVSKATPRRKNDSETFDVHGPDPNEVVQDLYLFAGFLDAWRTQHFQQAFEKAKTLRSRYGENVRFLELYLSACIKLERYEDVFETVDGLFARGDGLAQFWPNFPTDLAKLVDIGDQETIPLLQKTLAFDPCDSFVRVKLGEAYRFHGDPLREQELRDADLAGCTN